jgi:hypothetical protein
MSIDFHSMPEAVTNIYGPSVVLPNPATVSELSAYAAHFGLPPVPPHMSGARILRLCLRRDFNVIKPFAYNEVLEMRTLDGDISVSMGTVEGRSTRIEKDGFRGLVNVFLDHANKLSTISGGSLRDAAHAFVQLPYYVWDLKVGLDGTLLSTVDREHVLDLRKRNRGIELAPRRKFAQISPNKFSWRRRLTNLPASGWDKLIAADAIPGIKRDAEGPYVPLRGGTVLRPRDAAPV